MSTPLAIAQCLPNEITGCIALHASQWPITHRDSPETLKNASLTCRSWREAFQRQVCHTIFMDESIERADTFVRWYRLLRRYPVRALCIRQLNYRSRFEERFEDVFRNVGSTLRSLILSGQELPRFSADTWRSLSQLEELSLYGSNEHDFGQLPVVVVPSVRRLDINYLEVPGTVPGIEKFLSNFELPGLEDLTMSLDYYSSHEGEDEVENVEPLLQRLFTGSKRGIRDAKFQLRWCSWDPAFSWTMQLARQIDLCSSSLRTLELEIIGEYPGDPDVMWPDLEHVVDALGPDTPLERLVVVLVVYDFPTWGDLIKFVEDTLRNCRALGRLRYLGIEQLAAQYEEPLNPENDVWGLEPSHHFPDGYLKEVGDGPAKFRLLEGARWNRVREQCRERGIEFVLRSRIDVR